jgi:hypothetical protein
MLALVKTAGDQVLVERLKEAHAIVVGEEHVALVVIHDVVHAEQVYVDSATPSPPHRRMRLTQRPRMSRMARPQSVSRQKWRR